MEKCNPLTPLPFKVLRKEHLLSMLHIEVMQGTLLTISITTFSAHSSVTGYFGTKKPVPKCPDIPAPKLFVAEVSCTHFGLVPNCLSA